ncbi:MAG TPA: hypothetical protein VG408_05015 [Actinomycetota bacterium]|nr:hypothetical protein [Actinomycetota bacterium]
MDQLAWTLAALLAASIFGNTYYLGSKIDSRFDHLSARIDHLSARIDSLVGELGDLRGEVAALRTAFEMHIQDPRAHHSH